MANMSSQPTLELVGIGTGTGSTHTFFGEPSSSFAIARSGVCELLVDLGMGVARRVIEQFGEFPTRVFVTHNHSDHSGELPVVAITAHAKGRKITVYSAPEVQERLRAHRLHEFAEAGLGPDDLADWRPCPEGSRVEIAPDLTLETHRGRHSEISFGFRLYHLDRPILAFSGDSGFDATFYSWLAAAPLLILDGRATPSQDHAGFAEIESFARFHPERSIRVTHYGRSESAPRNLPALRSGERLTLV